MDAPTRKSPARRRESQLRLEGIVASAMDAIITIDEDQRIVLFNPAAERMFGWSADEALGKHIDQFIPKRFRKAHHEHIRRFGKVRSTNRRMGSLGSVSGLRSTGEEFPIEASISQVEVGSQKLFTVILRDVTERKAAEEALLESRRRMEGIVQSAMDAIISVDEKQRIVLFNPAAERMFGCSADDALGQSLSRFIPERFRAGHDEHIRRFRQTGVTSRRMGALGAISGLRSNGEEFPIEASISQVVVGGEQLSTVILRDITERRTSEETRGLLAREVDHRAKNALAVAQALISLTKADSVEDFAAAIKGRIAALARAHSLLSQSEWKGAELRQVIKDELSTYAKDGQIQFEGVAVTCSADAVQSLSLMFHELATNAVKYGALSREQGRVAISWKPLADSLLISWDESGGPEVKAPEGTGFGTRLLNQVAVRQLNAEIAFDWRPSGLLVEVSIPSEQFRLGSRSEARQPDAPSQAERRDKPMGIGRVLLVEDEELVALELSEELSNLGWAVVGPAATLSEALDLIADDFDAAVLDVNLRGRSVYPVAEELVRRCVPFVFCTGYEIVDPEGRFPGAPVMRKPTSAQAIAAALGSLLRDKRIRRGGMRTN
jgi:PAS domain S-box-containing protein